MNDGYDRHPSTQETRVSDAAGIATHFALAPAGPETCRGDGSGLAELAAWLPRLGPVLWLERKKGHAHPKSLDSGSPRWLLGHPSLAPLSTCQALHAHVEVSTKGPREWLCFHSGDDEVDAKLFLLPDSDLLAWDQMCAALSLTAVRTSMAEPPTHATFMRRAISRMGHSWLARLFEFRLRALPGLHALDARPPLRISLLGFDVAQRILNDEHGVWLSPLHRP